MDHNDAVIRHPTKRQLTQLTFSKKEEKKNGVNEHCELNRVKREKRNQLKHSEENPSGAKADARLL